MKRLIVISILTVILAAYASTQSISYLGEPQTCTGCHVDIPYHRMQQNSSFSLLTFHGFLNITCIDCHSGSGIKGFIEARRTVVNAIVLVSAKPAIEKNSNTTSRFALDTTALKANCIKCHEGKGGKEDVPRAMGVGLHMNLTCTSCHGTNIEIPACTTCHSPPRHRVNLTNTDCLGCHIDPHLPVLNAQYNTNVPNVNCASCHPKVYKNLTAANTRHTKVFCVNCHPSHGQKLACGACHPGYEKMHVHRVAGDGCGRGACHGYVKHCRDCHKDPHKPFEGMPPITNREQLRDYAKKVGNLSKR